MWRIRKAISVAFPNNVGYLTADEYAVTFNAQAAHWLDVAQLERAPAPGESDGERIARVALYQGELLPGFYDDWVAPERDRVQAVYETRMRELMEHLLAAHQWQTAVTWAEKWIALGQTPEAAYRALMVAYASLGDRAQAAAAYERCAQALHNELGVEPSDETRALYEQLRRGDVVTRIDLNAPRLVGGSKPLLYDEPPAPGEPPFKGLEFFDEQDANLFFGREQLIEKLADEIRAQKFLAVVVGASGSGKSSVVRAGLVPALRNQDGRLETGDWRLNTGNWRIFVMTPTAHPLEALATALTREESLTVTAQFMDDLAREPRSLRLWLTRVMGDWRLETHSQSLVSNLRFLLVVDQFEELFTLCRDDLEREQFIDNLVNALNQSPVSNLQSPSLTLVLTIRADFYAHLAQYPELRDLVAKQQEYIGPMNTDELRRAIEKPALENGWEFEPGLVDLILRDVGDEPGALPLLSHALLETWKRRSGHLMTLKGYHDAGGVRGAIAHTAESTYQQLTPEQQNIARNIFVRLTELGEGTEDTRRRAEIGELETGDFDRAQVRHVLTLLADARLITTSEHTAEVAHEALIREWARLREWLNEDREGLKLHRNLTEAAHEWELMERDASMLYRGARLAAALEFASVNPGVLNANERAFLEASEEREIKEIREREEQQQRELLAAQRLAAEQQARIEESNRANKRLRQRAVFLAGVVVIALLAASAALLFLTQSNANLQTADEQERTATSRELAANAIANLEVDPERSILLALQAVDTTRKVDGTVLREAEEALHRAVGTSRIVHTITGITNPNQIAYSPDGARLAIRGKGVIKIFDTSTTDEIVTIAITPGYSDHIAFSPDGKQLVTVDAPEEDSIILKVFDTQTGATRRSVQLPVSRKDWTYSAYSQDWKRVAVGLGDGTTKVFDMQTGKELISQKGHTDMIEDVAYSPDGTRIVTASDDHTAKIWDANSGKELLDLKGHTGKIFKVSISADGSRIATASEDNTAKIWDSKSGAQSLTLAGHNDWVLKAIFSGDNSRIATISQDGNAKVWDAETGKELITLTESSTSSKELAFNAQGTRLATTAANGIVKIWDLSAGHEVFTIPTDGPLSTLFWAKGTVVYSPDGKYLAAGFRDGNVKIWHAVSGQEYMTLKGHTDGVNIIAFNQDSSFLVTASSDQTAKVWNVATGNVITTLSGHKDTIPAVAISPDSRRVATASQDNTVNLWDLATGKVLATFANSTAQNGTALGVAFSPDGSHLMTSFSDGSLSSWDIDTGKAIYTIFPEGGVGVMNIAYSPDGSRLALAGDILPSIVVDATTGDKIFTLGNVGINARQIAYSRDGKLIATAHVDGTASLWDAATGKEILTLYSSPIFKQGVAFSPDGTRLALASDEDIRVFYLHVEDLITLAKTRVTRALTQEECQKYLHLEKCPQ